MTTAPHVWDAGDPPPAWIEVGGVLVPRRGVEERIVGLDLFSGCGGFSLGMQDGGIDVVGAVESWPIAAMTYLLNLGRPDCRIAFDSPETEAEWHRQVRKGKLRRARERKKSGGSPILSPGEAMLDVGEPGWIGAARTRWCADADVVNEGCRGFFLGDAANVSGQQLLELCGVDHFHVVFGGPPCQGLSVANSRKRGVDNPLNGCIYEFMRLVDELRPDMFIMENVPQILTIGNGVIFRRICEAAPDYHIAANILDCANYGIPQRRRRALIFGDLTTSTRPPFRIPMPSTWALGRRADGTAWNMLEKEFDEDVAADDEPDLPAMETLPLFAEVEP